MSSHDPTSEAMGPTDDARRHEPERGPGLADQEAEPTVALQRVLRSVGEELAGRPEEEVLAELRRRLPEDSRPPEGNLRAAATAIAEGRHEDGSR